MQHHSKLTNALLTPIAVLYGAVTALRNLLYDIGVMNSYTPTAPCIVVGNLTTGGTGKSPMIEYLVNLFITNNKTVTAISRGYGRTTKGYREVQLTDTATDVGDEPLQFKHLFGAQCTVIVDEKRTRALKLLRATETKHTVYLLDDALQHRAVKGSMNILLTAYYSVFIHDHLLPVGNLRESKNGYTRASIIVVTKCPITLTAIERNTIRKQLKLLPYQHLFFSGIEYGALVRVNNTAQMLELNTQQHVISFSGIANDAPFVAHLQEHSNVLQHISFPDHHTFTTTDIDTITALVNAHNTLKPIVITTHKDAMRLLQLHASFIIDVEVYYLPTKMYFSPNEQQQFNQLLLQHAYTN
jgi:tetraacyldisaccharide 4'-kinase